MRRECGAGRTTHTDATGAGVQNCQVDLGVDRRVDQAFISNRDACCPDRLSNYRVSVYNALNVEIAGQDFLSQPAGGTQPANLGGITGRTVRVQQPGLNNGGNDAPLNLNDEYFLMLADVGIYGAPIPEPGTASFAVITCLALLRRRRR